MKTRCVGRSLKEILLPHHSVFLSTILLLVLQPGEKGDGGGRKERGRRREGGRKEGRERKIKKSGGGRGRGKRMKDGGREEYHYDAKLSLPTLSLT